MDALPLTPSPVTTPFGHSFGLYSCGTASVVTSAPNIHEGTSSAPPTKPKQSKSRNGCVTCKAKRLKCDEAKPTCQQCTKRGVACGGYKKDFKWRPFEETSIANRVWKPTRKASKRKTSSRSASLTPTKPQQRLDESGVDITVLRSGAYTPPDIVVVSAQTYLPTPPQTAASLDCGDQLFDFDCGQFSDNVSVASSMTSPRVGDLLAADTDNDVGVLDPHTIEADPYGLCGVISPSVTNININQDIGEVILGSDHDWQLYPSDALSTISASQGGEFVSLFDTFRRPAVTMDSSEIILAHFDKNTCGIMSVKDGPTENPWRTLIWPMAQDSPALYHAISAMSAFHMSQERPQIRMEGVEHMRKSIRFLSQGLSHGNINDDAALATTLVLAFSEAFDRHISTGIEHLRGAKILINQALAKSNMVADPSWMRRFQFLYNVWVYLNVLARLTSKTEDGIQTPSLYGPFSCLLEVDPLLGCASTLFPLIGRAASMGQLVRNCAKNSISLISEASGLQVELENWTPEEYYEPIKDASNDVLHCIQTAHAYRWATLLYLHQAVPELPSLKAHELAEKVMGLLAGIPISSRSCIVHIFPLLVAGCEAVGDERDWVQARWEEMSNRMRIGNVIKAWQVTQEVWQRRDLFNAAHTVQNSTRSLSPQSSRYSSPVADMYMNTNGAESRELSSPPITPSGSPSQRTTENFRSDCRRTQVSSTSPRELAGDTDEYGFSLRGRLHWMAVMTERHWEVLLG